MESINSQIGQTFAVNSTGRPSSVDAAVAEQGDTLRPPGQTSLDMEIADPKQNGNLAKIQTPEQVGIVQVNEDFADKTKGEQRNNILDIEEASRDIEQFLQSQTRNLVFSVDETTNRSVVTVTESGSGDVIRQIPSEEVLRLAERLEELRSDVGSSVGVLFDNRA